MTLKNKTTYENLPALHAKQALQVFSDAGGGKFTRSAGSVGNGRGHLRATTDGQARWQVSQPFLLYLETR